MDKFNEYADLIRDGVSERTSSMGDMLGSSSMWSKVYKAGAIFTLVFGVGGGYLMYHNAKKLHNELEPDPKSWWQKFLDFF